YNICGLELSMYGYGAQVLRNKIHGLENASPDGGGAYGIDIPIPVSVDTMYIMNNIIYDIRTINYSPTNYNQNPFGIRILGTTKLKLWYNSVNLYGSQVDVGTAGTLSAAIAFIAPIYYELDMRNNVFSNTLEGLEGSRSYAIWAWAIFDILDTLITSVDYNDYYAGGPYGILGNIGAPEDATNNACDPLNNKYTLGEWQAATLQDTNSLSVNPEFIANDNLEPLIASPLIGAGIYFEEVPEDIRGLVRNDPPTIGAYEGFGEITLLSPENLAQKITITPLFSWELVQGYNLYNLQVATDVEFDSIALEQFEIEGNSFQTPIQTPLLSTSSSDPFFWRVQAVSPSGSLSEWSEVWSFTTELWPNVENTGSFSTIVVPFNIPAIIGNRPMSNGDAIGVFFQPVPNEWQCAGYGVWNGQSVGITVWGDDPDTPVKDGFYIGEEYTFLVWDAVEANTVFAYATYILGPEEFEVGGFSMLASLNTNQFDELNINLGLGWNCISSYIAPEDDDVEIMLASIENNVKIMKNSTGDMYVPAYNINTIGNWNINSAYLINMINADVLTISGSKITPELAPINLNNGWNLSAYLRDNEMSVVTALASITPSLVLAKNNAGGIYSPVYGINTLGNMAPTQGYYFYMNAAAQLTYPANSAMKSNLDVTTPSAKNLIPAFNNTGNNATLLLSIENNDRNEIGVYNQNNELVGSGAIYNGIAAITIWGDDESSSIIDGAQIDENLFVKILNTANNTTDALSLTNIKDITSNNENQGLIYKSNAIYSAKAVLGTGVNNTLTISNSPNPVESNTKFEFNLIEDGNTLMNIYNVNGELVASIANNYNAGMHNINFDASNLANGIYNVVLLSGNQSVSTLMIVGK
nr:T9SS type A sorting domain-containing protein [Candidatus Kapabacteria bacterium]